LKSRSIMFVAGDPSGDAHAAHIIRQLRVEEPNTALWGIGGPHMVAQGFTSLMPFEPFNKMGFVEVIANLQFFLNAKKNLINEMTLRRPDCLVCVDYPGFNMPMMQAAYKIGIPVVWYIAPMVWAWKRKRAAILGKCASHIACIFPFEVEYFSPYTENVSFVGNPTVEARDFNALAPSPDGSRFSIALIPGSRKQELERMLRPMLDAFKILKTEFPLLTATVSKFGILNDSLFDIVKNYDGVGVTTEPINLLLKKVNCAIVKSGTATLETALAGIPMVIAYKTSQFNYSIARLMVKLKNVGLPNIIAKTEIVPECIQSEMNSQTIAAKMRDFITNKEYYTSTMVKLIELKDALGAQKPSLEVTQRIRMCADKKSLLK
jgi:lipid-A-disaccharide synthase